MKSFVSLTSLVLLLALGTTASAEMLKTEPSTQKIEGVAIAKSGVVSLDQQDVKLTTAAAGLRWKRVIAKVPVYVGQLLVTQPELLVKKDAEILTSTDKETVGAISMTFLRTVDAATVFSSFRDSLVANKVNLDDAAIKGFLNMVNAGGEATKGKTLTLLLVRQSGGAETVTYENAAGASATVTGGAGFLHQVYSIWLGASADSGLADLKLQWLNWVPAP